MAAPTAPILGANGKAYRNTGTYGSPTWNLVPNCHDVEAPWEYGDHDVSQRLSLFKMHEPTLADIGFSIKQMYDPADEDYQAFLTAMQARAAVDIALLDQAQATAGSQGPRMLTKIFKGARQENLEGVMEFVWDFKLCYSTNPPTWMTTS